MPQPPDPSLAVLQSIDAKMTQVVTRLGNIDLNTANGVIEIQLLRSDVLVIKGGLLRFMERYNVPVT